MKKNHLDNPAGIHQWPNPDPSQPVPPSAPFGGSGHRSFVDFQANDARRFKASFQRLGTRKKGRSWWL